MFIAAVPYGFPSAGMFSHGALVFLEQIRIARHDFGFLDRLDFAFFCAAFFCATVLGSEARLASGRVQAASACRRCRRRRRSTAHASSAPVPKVFAKT
jgi:hypothetical protein